MKTSTFFTRAFASRRRGGWLPLFVVAAAMVAGACSSGKSAYKRGDYYQATLESINKLRSSPDKTDAQDILLLSYPLAVKASLREVDKAMTMNVDSKYDAVVAQYERLNQLADAILRSPKASELIPAPREFFNELREAREEAAGEAYRLGVTAMNVGTLEGARVAYRYFERANHHVSGYRDVVNKLKESLYASTMRVILEAPATPAHYQLSSDFFYANLIAELNQLLRPRMVRLYSPEEAFNENMRDPHYYIALDFTTFAVGNVRESKSTIDVSRDSVVVGKVTVEGRQYDAYATVSAKFTRSQREISSSGTLSVRITEPSNRKIVGQRAFSGQYVWTTTWGSFTGDDRALNTEQKNLCRRQAGQPPAEQEFFIEFTRPIYAQVVDYITRALPGAVPVAPAY
ncbi:MAG: hypothetical protein LBI96_01610 [Odoribacteraceae bacterium]|nr:hypothetical protein [Odoribacteraceae bacterium]